MEMERINDDTIRVMIENSDLKDRGISIMELLGNQEKIESFFYGILAEVDVDHDFIDDDQVTFQILPNKNGLELFITRFSEENHIGDVIENVMKYAKNKEHSDDVVTGERRSELNEVDNGELSVDERVSSTHSTTFKINNFESVVILSQSFEDEKLLSDLYRYQNYFYLTIRTTHDDMSQREFDDKIATVLEFCDKSQLDGDILSEHAISIIKNNALQQLNQIFNKSVKK